jgi:hypothetical protein
VKLFLSFILLLAGCHLAPAQTYSLLPGDSVEQYGFLEDLHTLTIEMENISSNTVTLGWKKVDEFVPLYWEASTCDNVICYTTLQDSGTMNPVITGDKGFLLMHITPHVNYGICTIRYMVWDINFPSQADTLTYILHVINPTGIQAIEPSVEAIIFPNPANDFITIYGSANASAYKLTDGSGKIISAGTLNSNSINVSVLPAGLYNFSFTAGDKLYSRKIVISR